MFALLFSWFWGFGEPHMVWEEWMGILCPVLGVSPSSTSGDSVVPGIEPGQSYAETESISLCAERYMLSHRISGFKD